ncbi:MAG: zeta toxin family protein [Muribaculaceae bacterium]|nr:zeta toxin family protein [Muribaculaceae bacterium]
MRKEGHRPILIVIAGPNGSGKTTVTHQLLKSDWIEDAIYINPDQIAQEKFGDWNSKEAVYEAAKFCEKLREDCLIKRKSLIFETVLSAPDKLDYIARAKQAGYFIRIFFISTKNPTINAARIANRVMKGGHDVPIPKIISRYSKSIANCSAIAKKVDRLYVYDNSAENKKLKPLFRLTNGVLGKKYIENVPEWARNILPETDEIQIQNSKLSD